MKGLWVSVSGALAREKEIENIANNVANATTPGFKKDRMTFREYLTVLDKGYSDIDLPDKPWSPRDFYRSYGAENAKVVADGSFTDFSQGQLKPTGNPFDLALDGTGFFEILTPGGIRATRRGTFTLSADGFLVNAQGHHVLAAATAAAGDAGQRRIRLPARGKVFVDSSGTISLDGGNIGSLSIVHFKDRRALKKEGNSYFINAYGDNAAEGGTTLVRQGFVEESNVNALSEMSELIKANRQFESIQRVIKAYDHIADKVANDIASF